MYDDSGEELLTRVDSDRKLFILSDRCRGRHAVVALFTMMLSAWQHERGRPSAMEFEQLASTASIMERFLVDLGIEDVAIERLVAPPAPATAQRPRPKTPRYLLAAALIAITAGAWWSIATHLLPPSSPEPVFQAQTVDTPLPRLTPQHQPYTTALSNAVGVTAANPVADQFVIATANNTIQSVDLAGNTETLTKTAAPVTWLDFSRNGRYLAAADQQRNLYLLSGDNLTTLHQWTANRLPVNVTVNNDGRLTWIDHDGTVFTTDPTTPAISRVLDCIQTLSINNAQAFVRQRQNHHELEILIDGQPLPIKAQLPPNQLIHDFDATDNLQTLTLMLNDGTLLVFRQTADNQYRLEEHAFPPPTGHARVRLSRNGQRAVVLTDQLYRLNINLMRITAETPLPVAAGPAYDLVWREAFDEIAVAQAQKGTAWRYESSLHPN